MTRQTQHGAFAARRSAPMQRHWTALAAGLAVGLLVLVSSPASAADWYVATSGSSSGAGTLASPWDITTALDGTHKVAPGDTVWIRGGTYRKYHQPMLWEENLGQGYVVKLVGAPGKPIHVRPYRGERVTIDGGLQIQSPTAYLWIWGLEIIVSDPRPGDDAEHPPIWPVSGFANVERPWGGLNVLAGAGCKYINLVIHRNCNGVGFWRPSVDSELYGCLIYDNGWAEYTVGHGHAVYTQNETGTKVISDCILTGSYGYAMHAYGSSSAYVDNYVIEGNIAYTAQSFLVGGGRPSRNIHVRGNYVYGMKMQVGYNASYNEDCEVSGNTLLAGGIQIQRYRQVTRSGNLVVGGNTLVISEQGAQTSYPGDPRPAKPTVVVRPNKYEPGRANVAVFNWNKEPSVDLDPGTVLRRGDRFRLLKPEDFFGTPVLTGVYTGEPIRVPMTGEFAAFVLMRGPASPAQ